MPPKKLLPVALFLATAATATAPGISFADAAPGSGLDFVLHNSPTTHRYLPETMAGGMAAFDFDGDGRLDLFFANGAEMPGLSKSSAAFSDRLYRNLGNGKFTDVTAASGLAGTGYSIAAAAADFENSGHPGLLVAGVKGVRLYRNAGNGRFEDITSQSGIQDSEFSVAAAWFDYDRDGLLDLLVVHYVEWSAGANPLCQSPSKGESVYCHPKEFAPTANALYRNLGHGKFQDVSAASGIARYQGKGMGVAIADYDRDGFPDIFITNDVLPNFLFHNEHGTGFREVALDAGVALPDNGAAVSGMGADFRDYDNDGLPDIVFTALQGQTFPLFRNLGHGQFAEASQASKLAGLTGSLSGWSIAFADLDNDGWKDIFSANSHVSDNIDRFSGDRYRLPNAVFRNQGSSGFQAMAPAGSAAAHRGAAVADFDNDGRLDAVVSVLGERPEFWRNVTANGAHWIDIKLTGTASNRDGIGAEIRIGRQVNSMTSAVGYASSVLAPVHFGLGAVGSPIADIEILWPSGTVQHLRGVRPDQVLTVTEPPRQP